MGFDFYYKTGLFQLIGRHPVFENCTLAVIAFNALWMWVDTDSNKAVLLFHSTWWLQLMEHLFCLYFTFEWFVRFMAFKVKRNGLKDGWFVFDSCLVFMMVSETWALNLYMIILGGTVSLGGSTGLLRLFRLLRLSRL